MKSAKKFAQPQKKHISYMTTQLTSFHNNSSSMHSRKLNLTQTALTTEY